VTAGDVVFSGANPRNFPRPCAGGADVSPIGSRICIAGSLDNQHVNMIQWLQDPHAINPRTVMPTMGVTERDARDIAAYLHSLK
jgi:cytochrome c1